MSTKDYQDLFLPNKQIEHIFKTVGNVPIDLGVFYSEKPPAVPAPVFLYWHGGYLVTGDRIDHPIWLTNACLRRGWVFVSANYRLIPESTALDTLEDLTDAYNFVRTGLSSLLPYSVDTSRIIIGGSSAGGYCALLAATQLSPPPKAAFLIYPVANPSSERYVHKGNLLVDAPQGTKAKEVLAEIDEKIARKEICVGQALNTRPDTRTSQYMRYIIQEGKYADYLSGDHDLAHRVRQVGEERGVPDHVKKVFPTAFSIRKDLPPMVIVHGRADRAIYISESERLVNKLRDVGATFEFFPVDGAEHAFDFAYIDIESDDKNKDGVPVLLESINILEKWIGSGSLSKI